MEPTYHPGFWACYSGARCYKAWGKGEHENRNDAIKCAERTRPQGWDGPDPSRVVARVGEFPDMTPGADNV